VLADVGGGAIARHGTGYGANPHLPRAITLNFGRQAGENG
jgi:hypothetical protein